MKPKQKYQCVVCKTVSEHLPLRRKRTICRKCCRKTRHQLLVERGQNPVGGLLEESHRRQGPGKLTIPQPVSPKSNFIPDAPSQTFKVEHVPEPRHLSPSVGQEKAEGEEEIKPETRMISPAGIFAIAIELPNSVIITLQPSLGKELELTNAEITMFREWAGRVYQYCVSRGYTIPDSLQLIPIFLTPAAFYLKRVRLIISAKKKEEKKEPESEPCLLGVDTARKAQELADMKILEKALRA